MVDSRAAEAMVSYMRWKSALDAPKKYGQGMIREYKADYLSERKKAKMRINSIKVAEFDDMHRITSKLAPRA
jgi:2-iminoacetate synthase ThiH